MHSILCILFGNASLEVLLVLDLVLEPGEPRCLAVGLSLAGVLGLTLALRSILVALGFFFKAIKLIPV